MERSGASLTVGSGAASSAQLNHKTLRLAVHGWRLGNPLVYKSGEHNLFAVANAFASAGATSGACIVGDEGGADATQIILILRPAAQPALLGMAAACTVAEVVEGALGRLCVVNWPCDVALHDDRPADPVCQVSVEVDEAQDVAFMRLQFALGLVWDAHRDAYVVGAEPSPLFARSDWREVLLARTLHTLDTTLNDLFTPERETARKALQDEWRRRLAAPYRVIIVRSDGSRIVGAVEQIAPDETLSVRDADGAMHTVSLDKAIATGGGEWAPTTKR